MLLLQRLKFNKRLSSTTNKLDKDLFCSFYVDSVQPKLHINRRFSLFAITDEFVHAEFNCACAGARFLCNFFT
jgi:hypothetical protein